MKQARILLVEDEKNIREAVSMNLELEGYEVIAVGNGKDALQVFGKQRFSLVILDVMLPEMDGFTICEKMRLQDMDVPVLFLTAKDRADDKVKGFRLGGDDYLTKPFNLEELLLRVKALVKRGTKGVEEAGAGRVYEFAGNTVNFATYEAKGINGNFTLTKKEAMLLKLLTDRKNEAVSRERILEYVWGYDIYPSTRTIDNFILSFRKYFEKDPRNPRHFHSVRGIGYKFTE